MLVVRIAEALFSEYIFMLLGFKFWVQKWNVRKKYLHKILKKQDTNTNYALFKEYNNGHYYIFLFSGLLQIVYTSGMFTKLKSNNWSVFLDQWS